MTVTFMNCFPPSFPNELVKPCQEMLLEDEEHDLSIGYVTELQKKYFNSETNFSMMKDKMDFRIETLILRGEILILVLQL